MRQQPDRILVFDVNETLLDIKVLTPFFAHNFGDADVVRQWFTETILYAQSLTLADQFVPFHELCIATLQMVAQTKHVTLSKEALEAFSLAMGSLPVHPEVPEALECLAREGFRMVTLSNSALDASKAVLTQSGIMHYFERVFSVEQVGRYKPAPQTYEWVTQELGVVPSRLMLIAAHPWDTLGALAAGFAAALVTRPGSAPLGIGGEPDIVGPNLLEVARKIISEAH